MCMVLTTRYASKSLNYLIKVPTIHDSHPQSLWLKEPPRFPDIRTPRQPHLHRLPHNHPPRLLLISNTFGNEGGVRQGQRRRGNFDEKIQMETALQCSTFNTGFAMSILRPPLVVIPCYPPVPSQQVTNATSIFICIPPIN